MVDIAVFRGRLAGLEGFHAAGDNESTAQSFFDLLGDLETQSFGSGPQANQAMGSAILRMLNILCDPAFRVPDRFRFALLQHNCLIANLMAGCLGMTTDPYLELVKGDPQELYKTLVLYSARNRSTVDIAKGFQLDPELVSQWLFQSWKLGLSGMCNRHVAGRLSAMLDDINPRIIPAPELHQVYFACTYLGNDRERRIKEIVNNAVQRDLRRPITNRPNPRKIAVFSDFFWRGHSVYRTQGHLIRALKEGPSPYHLTFIHAGALPEEKRDFTLFDEVIELPFDGVQLNIGPLERNDFAAVIFPDVGMTLTSIFLANQRIAPVQLAMVGHSASTFGACVDYYLSGAEVESAHHSHLNYSERLVLPPGYGLVHEKPVYQRKNPPREGLDLVVNGSWAGQKLHWTYLEALNRIGSQSDRPMRLQVFPGLAPMRHKGMPAFIREIASTVSSLKVEVFTNLPYQNYMETMEKAEFALDCFPFSGCNTVSDLLYLGIPVLCREGTRWFNRIGPAMLRSIGLEELVATTDAEYIKKAVRLANDEPYRAHLRERIAAADLDRHIYAPRGAREFRRFMDRVIADRDAFPGHEPIVLEREGE